MYAHFKGTIDSKFSDRIILDVNDIGYEIYMPESEILSLEDNKNKVKIFHLGILILVCASHPYTFWLGRGFNF